MSVVGRKEREAAEAEQASGEMGGGRLGSFAPTAVLPPSS